MNFCLDAKQIRRALADLELAEKHGFDYCLAVFDIVHAGRSIHECLGEYSDLIERADPVDGNFHWGRFQGVVRRNRFDKKKRKLIPIKGAK